jgi:predicted dehydrogenase
MTGRPGDAPRIGVGIVGASSTRGWAGVAHVPALRTLDAFELRGISTTRQETADETAGRLGIDLAFDDHRKLIDRREIDLVVVCVKVPDHYQIVSDAIDADKMIFCEWPLARNLEEAETLERRARERRLRTVVGLQGGLSPAIVALGDLVRQGVIGRPLSTSLRAHLDEDVWLGHFVPHYEFMADSNNGATMLSIGVGHALQSLSQVLGDFESLSAVVANQRGVGRRTQDAQMVPKDAPDEISVVGMLHGGVVASLHYSAGAGPGPSIAWDIQGSEGSLRVEAASGGHLHVSDLSIALRRGRDPARHISIPLAETGPLGKGAASVARLYQRLAADLAEGTSTVPNFTTALSRHRTLDAIMSSSATGRSIRP